MENQAIGMIETKGLVALVIATDAMLKAAKARAGTGAAATFLAKRPRSLMRCSPQTPTVAPRR